jgi:hypothetical protein
MVYTLFLGVPKAVSQFKRGNAHCIYQPHLSASSFGLAAASLDLSTTLTSPVVPDLADQKIYCLPAHSIRSVTQMGGCDATECSFADAVPIRAELLHPLGRVARDFVAISLVEGVSKQGCSQKLRLNLR